MCVSVSSFVKKTTEKINTLQMNSDLWPRPDQKEGVQSELTITTTPFLEVGDTEWVFLFPLMATIIGINQITSIHVQLCTQCQKYFNLHLV